MNVESSQNTVADNNISRNNTENQNITDNGKATNTATATAATTENTSRNTNAESNISGIDTDAYSDTPQTSVSGVNGVNDNYYLTNYRKNQIIPRIIVKQGKTEQIPPKQPVIIQATEQMKISAIPVQRKI